MWLLLLYLAFVYNSATAFHHGGASRPIKIKIAHGIGSTSPSTSRDDDTGTLSPWSPGKWKIKLHFRREVGSSSSEFSSDENTALINKLLGEGWGVDSHLVLPLEIMVTAELSSRLESDENNIIQSSWLGGKATGSIECINQYTSDNKLYHTAYISNSGQQHVQISSGNWRMEPPIPLVTSPNGKPLSGQASILRFHLTIKDAIQRNSVYFPENQLLLLQSNTFREDQYENGIRTILPYQYAKDNAQQMLDTQLDHESGDRRLDGTDLLPLFEGYKDMAGLIWERDEKYRKWKEVEGVLPLVDSAKDGVTTTISEDDEGWGVWPGDTDLMTVERGVILAAVDNKETKSRNRNTVYVGSWTAVPIWDEDEE